MNDNVTKEDMRSHIKDLKSHIDLTVAPIIKELDEHSDTLYGHNRRGGIVGDISRGKAWIASLCGIGGVLWAIFAYMS